MTAGTAPDPKRSTTYRLLLSVVIILGVLIVLAMGALIAGGVMKFTERRASAPAYSPAALTAELPSGGKIMSVETSGNRVVIAVRTAQGDEVDIFDTDTGRPVARIRTAPPQVPK